MRYCKGGVEKTLVWSQCGGSSLHKVFMFASTTSKIDIERPLLSTLSAVARSGSYYGPVSLGGLLDDVPGVAVEGEFLSLPKTTCHSWGDSMVVYQHTTAMTMLCPKGLIDEAAQWSVGKLRTHATFQSLLANLRHRVKKFNVPQGNLDSCLFACACLGFARNIAFEASTMHTVFAPLAPLNEVHANAMAFKFQPIRTWKRVVGLVIASLTGTAVLATGVGAIAGAAVGAAAAAAAVVGTAAYVIDKVTGPSGVGRGPDPTPSQLAFPGYHADRSSSSAVTRVVQLPQGINLPATDPPLHKAESIGPSSIAPKAKFDIRDCTTTREKDDQGPLRPLGIASSMAIPVVPSNSAASSVVAIASRILKAGPNEKGVTDSDFLRLFEKWVMRPENIGAFGPLPVKSTPFPEWNRRYPLAQQRTHLEAFLGLNIGNYSERLVDERGCFVKIEGLSKSTDDGVKDFAPRAIQSGTPIHNVATGPFCSAFSAFLAETWSVDAANGPVYTSGCSAEAIGARFRAACEKNSANLGILEGDFARFDSTVHRRLLAIEARIYKALGADPLTLHAILAGIKTRGRDKWGNKYAVDGGRHSGDHNTSCGNTLIQGLAIMFCLAYHDQLETGKWLSYTDLCSKYQLTLFLLGDDNLAVGDAALLKKVPLKALLLKLGLELEPKIHSGPDAAFQATFCSARFWPCVDEEGRDVTVLGPPIGRCVAKSGWYVGVDKKVDPVGLVRSDALGRTLDVQFIPFINKLWQRTLDLTQGAQAVTTAAFARDQRHRTHSRSVHRPSADTYSMVLSVYGLSAEQEQEYARELDKVKKLGSICDYAPLRDAMIIDGVLDGANTRPSDCTAFDTPPLGDDFDSAQLLLMDLPGLSVGAPLRCIYCDQWSCECDAPVPQDTYSSVSSEQTLSAN
jgi:hypothetical protein